MKHFSNYADKALEQRTFTPKGTCVHFRCHISIHVDLQVENILIWLIKCASSSYKEWIISVVFEADIYKLKWCKNKKKKIENLQLQVVIILFGSFLYKVVTNRFMSDKLKLHLNTTHFNFRIKTCGKYATLNYRCHKSQCFIFLQVSFNSKGLFVSAF